jgi:alkaline phosphatase
MFLRIANKLSAFIVIIFFAGCNAVNDKSAETPENGYHYKVSELKIASADSNYIDYKNSSVLTEKPKNIILLIGDGMGINQVIATRYRYYGILSKLYMERLPYTAIVNTSADGEFPITCSAAGGTAIATGKKTSNGILGMDKDLNTVPNITELCHESDMAIGMITTGKLAGATPGAFLSHVPDRDMKNEIAKQIVEGHADLLFGESQGFIEPSSAKGTSVLNEASILGFEVQHNQFSPFSHQETRQLILFDSIVFEHQSVKEGKLVHNPKAPLLPMLTREAIQFLNMKSENGFFLVIEEDQIDSWGHENNLDFVTWHMKNLDDAVKMAMDFAVQDKETLVIVTSDHETGGLNIIDAKRSSASIKAVFATDDHSAQPVPMYTFGPGSSLFQGTMENTQIFSILKELLE